MENLAAVLAADKHNEITLCVFSTKWVLTAGTEKACITQYFVHHVHLAVAFMLLFWTICWVAAYTFFVFATLDCITFQMANGSRSRAAFLHLERMSIRSRLFKFAMKMYQTVLCRLSHLILANQKPTDSFDSFLKSFSVIWKAIYERTKDKNTQKSYVYKYTCVGVFSLY